MASSIRVTLELDDKGYLSGIRTAKAETAGLGATAKASGVAAGEGFAIMSVGARAAQAAVMGLMASLAPLLAIGTAITAIGSAFSFADEISDLADASGVAMETIMGLQASLAAAGGNADDAGKMIQKLTNSLQDARNGSTQAYDKLDKLGLSLKDIQNLSPDEALKRTVERLAALKDPVERNALAFDLLGKSAANINWQQVSDGLGTTTEQQKRAAEEAAKLGQFMDDMGKVFYQAKLALVEFLGPIVEVIKKFSEFSGVATILRGIIAVLRVAFGAIAGVFVILAADIEVAASAFVALYEAMANVVKGDFSAAKKNLTDYGAHAKKVLADADASVAKLMGIGGGGGQGAASPQQENNRATREGAGLADELSRKLASVRSEILKNADAFRASNEQTREKIALDTRLIGLGEEQKRIQTEQTAIDDRAATAIRNLNEQKKQLGSGATDRAKAGAINETIKLIEAQAVADKRAVGEIITNNEGAKRAFENRAKELQASYGGDAMKRSLENEIRLLSVFREDERRILTETSKINEEFQQAILEANKKYGNDKKAVEQAIVDATVDYNNKLAALAGNKPLIEKMARDAEALNEARRKLDSSAPSNEFVRGLQDQLAQMQTTTESETALLKLRQDANRQYQTALTALNRQFAGERTADQEKEYQRQKALLDKSLDEQKTAIAGSADAIKELYGSMQFERFFSQAKDALVDFVMTGKLSFKDLAANLLRTFTKQMIDEMFNPLRDVLKGLFSGISTGISSFIGTAISSLFGGGRATGGPVMPGKLYRVGEHGPEWFTTSTAGTIIPNGAGVEPTGSITNINYSIQAVDASSFRQLVAQDPEFIYSVTQKGRMSIPGGRR